MRAGQERPGSPEHSPGLDANALAMGRNCRSYKEKARCREEVAAGSI